MKLSIFPNAESHPRTKEAKIAASKKVSKPNLPQMVEISSSEELINAVSSNAWSPFVFGGIRDEANFVSCDLLVYDIDEGMTIDEAEAIIHANKLCALCLPSPNHNPTEGINKFRLILPLSGTITDPQVYMETWASGALLFPIVDTSCRDFARWYGGCTKTDGFWVEGELYVPKKISTKVISEKSRNDQHRQLVEVSGDLKETVKSIYGKDKEKIPESVKFFITNANTGIEGGWTCAINAFAYSLGLSGIKKDVILEVCEKLAPYPLDRKDTYQVERACRDAEKNREI